MTYPFYCISRELPKFFNVCGDMAKSYSAELKLYQLKKSVFFNYKKFPLNNFLPNAFIWIGTLNVTCMQKIRVGQRAKFRDKNICFMHVLFPVCDFMLHFHFRYFACATFDRNLDSLSWRVHSSHVVCRLHMRTGLKTLTSLLNVHYSRIIVTLQKFCKEPWKVTEPCFIWV